MTSKSGLHEVHVKYRPDIDGLRALAVMSVVLFHAGVEFISGGYIGVDVFFVISGYLITGIILKGLASQQFSFIGFYARRVKRILPALLLVMSTCWAFGLIALLPDEFKSLGRHILAGATFSNNFLLWSEAGYFDAEAELKPLLHLWSLGVEEQFYILWPLLAFLAWRYRLRMAVLISLVAIISFGLNIYWTPIDNAAAFFLPYTRFWELATGAWLATAQAEKGSWSNRLISTLVLNKGRTNILAASGIAGLLSGMFILNKTSHFPGYWALLPAVSAALIIAAGPDTWVNRKLLARPAVVFVGLISYPLYLWHWPLLSFADILMEGKPSLSVRLLLVLCAFFFAWATYQFIEKPVRSGGKPTQFPRYRIVPILSVLLVMVGFVGNRTYHKHGILMNGVVTDDPLFWSESLKRDVSCQRRLNYSGSFCIQTPSGVKPSIALIGDSHANHYFPGLNEYAVKNGKALLHLGEAGCLPFLGIDTISKEEKIKSDCPEKVSKALKIATSMDSIDIIILSFRGTAYFTGRGFGEVDKVGFVLTDLNNHVLEQQDTNIFVAAFENTIQMIENSGKKLIIILDNPELGFRPQSRCLSRPLQISRNTQPCHLFRTEVSIRQEGFRRVVTSVLKNHPNVQVFDPMDYLCDERFCYAKKDGKLLYRDDDHLSVEGSSFMISHLFTPQQ